MTFQLIVVAYLLVFLVLLGLAVRYRPARPVLIPVASLMIVVPIVLAGMFIVLMMHAGI